MASAPNMAKRAITLQCGVFRETIIFEDQEFSVFLELVYFILDNKVFLCTLVLRCFTCLLSNIVVELLEQLRSLAGYYLRQIF